ncbi:MAG: hypothetical protein U1E27_03130, partial [Kiritimatiellia bacterium]|nr:hypothetical protein [Kiritimatiellia bacterium]
MNALWIQPMHLFFLACCAVTARAANPVGPRPVVDEDAVTYESVGAVGDGVADDLPAIRDAHDLANRQGRRVRSNPNATYHLGRQAITAIIATDTDWGTSRFIIDDSGDVENHRLPIFEVRSLLEPVPLKIERLKRNQARLEVRPPVDCLV